MDDSQLSAGELRRRYHAGGSVPDSELTASQLRSRHGIASNSKNFSDKPLSETSSLSTVAIMGGIVLLAMLLAAGLYMSGVVGK
ncbi:hypothetical protein FNF27_07031 [Cafeteria roenbergensis]|uniref:Cation-transporting P-type ATPase N-terminal domain-containing protein n=2 Tax=Cafeteria roenbergensis TaxID=33653 RepID=A0A5A8DEX5_CAFRO|nr:hypothetical protein FNF29_07465 [Cafeteria roenbergensis]KAA0157352.1 hypothetical protein FNF31_05777 [Cafeteria roenbergensis]KAA0163529.1 hypothetical protein FNF28_04186 [Cafeteria roenbergensis]KAA0169212.1 hypothetical protein FNF27_07031 [Cafeteria roenbergensis]|eukprot:KAA0147296.1 hypothetical protein FNF29_07465 [Cafeteria roenbergensis]